MAQRAFFYGWFLVPILWVLYGFGITPAYAGWGIISTKIVEELQFDRGQIGFVSLMFIFLYSATGPIVGLAQDRLGIRAVMTVGFFVSALGFWLTAMGDAPWHFYAAWGFLGGAGVGLSTIIPCQTLAQNWFVKYRARIIAVIFIAGGIVGGFFPQIIQLVIEREGWREAVTMIAALSAALGVMAFLFVRDTPEQLGQLPDNKQAGGDVARSQGLAAPVNARVWTANEAMRTKEFFLLVVAGVAYAVPWAVVSVHGPLHFTDQGFDLGLASSLIATMFLVSSIGRLSGSLGDWVPPQLVLAGALFIELLGVGAIYLATSPAVAYLGVSLMGLGFGASYISIPVVFANFFGRKAFATTSGTRILITGIFQAAAPFLAGEAFDRLGSYSAPFIVVMVLVFLGVVAAAVTRHPGEPPEILEQPLGARVAP